MAAHVTFDIKALASKRLRPIDHTQLETKIVIIYPVEAAPLYPQSSSRLTTVLVARNYAGQIVWCTIVVARDPAAA